MLILFTFFSLPGPGIRDRANPGAFWGGGVYEESNPPGVTPSNTEKTKRSFDGE